MKTIKFFRLMIILWLVTGLLLSACWPFTLTQKETQPGTIYTSAAETIMAQLTSSAGNTAVALLTQIAQSSGTPLVPATAATTELTSSATATVPADTPSPTATATATASATATATSTATLVPTVMPTYVPTATKAPPTYTPTSIPCNWAQFVKDVTVPDGTIFPPNQAFTKTWRLRNIGSCAWKPGYSLVFHSGDRMHTTSTVPLNVTVQPGATVDVSVNMIAPSLAGQYRSYWMLSTNSGYLFGIGPNADRPFWVDIQVVVSAYVMDFIQQMCSAIWQSSSGTLPCPGNPTNAGGAVLRLNQPLLETGKLENEPALITLPARVENGWISGVYPPYKVQTGDRFLADVGCLADSIGCDVTFYLSYQLSGGPMIKIDSWHEIYDLQITRVNVDLSFLAGQTVQFILRVVNNGKPEKANAFWLVPSIRK